MIDNTKVDISSESGSLSDRTLIIDDNNDYLALKLYNKSKVVSKKKDDDFNNYNYHERFYSKANNPHDDTSHDTTITSVEDCEESSYDSDLTHKNSTGTLISLCSSQFGKIQGNETQKKDTTNEFNIFEKENSLIKKMLEEIDDEDDGDNDEEDEIDSDINKILYIPSDTRRKLCLSPLQSKIKVNMESSQKENNNNLHDLMLDSLSHPDRKGHNKSSKKRNNHKKCKSEGSYLAFNTKYRNNKKEEEEDKSRLQKNHQNNSGNHPIKNEQEKQVSLLSDHHRISNVSKNGTGMIKRSQSLKDHPIKDQPLKDQPSILPRGVSIIQMKNRMRKNVKSEKLVKSYIDNSEKKNFFKTLPLNKSAAYNADFNTLLKRRYRENQIKILYRTEYYMQTLDDTDYDSYDKALFDDQLFINVENNETDYLKKEVSKEELSSSSSSKQEDFTTKSLDLLSKRQKRNPNIISPLYQQLVDRIHKNKKEREMMEEEKKQKEKNKSLLLSPDFSIKECEERNVKTSNSQNKLCRYGIADFDTILASLKNKTFQSPSNNSLNRIDHRDETQMSHYSCNRRCHSNGITLNTKTNDNNSILNNNESEVYCTSSLDSPTLKKSKSCSHLSDSKPISSASSLSSKQCSLNHQSSDSISQKSSTSNYAQPTDYYKQYNAENNTSRIYRNPSYLKHFYPYQAPTYDDYCYSSPIRSLLSYRNTSSNSLNSSCSSEVSSSNSTLTATDQTYMGCLDQDFTSYYNYNKTYNLPYTSGIDILAYY